MSEAIDTISKQTINTVLQNQDVLRIESNQEKVRANILEEYQTVTRNGDNVTVTINSWRESDAYVAPVYTAEYQAILDNITSRGLSLPTLSDQTKQNTVVQYLKSTGIWNDLDLFYFLGNTNSGVGRVNWKSPSTYYPSIVGSPSWSTKGFKSVSNGYLNTGFAPSNAVQGSQNDCGAFFFCTNVNENSIPFGSNDGSSYFYMNLAQSATLEIIRPNSSASGGQVTLEFTQGFWHLFRSSSLINKSYYNAYIELTNSNASSTPNAKPLFICGHNNNGTAADFCTRDIGIFGFGKSLSTQTDNIHAISAYLLAGSSITPGTGIKPLIVFAGESGSNGAAKLTQATTAQLAKRSSIKIYQNTVIPGFQDLQIGLNNLIGNYPSGGQNCGWEVALADRTEAGTFVGSENCLVKTGRGGSVIANWDVGAVTNGINYWQVMQDKTDGAIASMRSAGYTPRLYFLYSQGINDIAASTSVATWKQKTKDHITKVRAKWASYGPCPFVMMQFWNSPVDYSGYNAAMSQIASEMSDVYVVSAQGLSLRNNEHLDMPGNATWCGNALDVIRSNYGL